MSSGCSTVTYGLKQESNSLRLQLSLRRTTRGSDNADCSQTEGRDGEVDGKLEGDKDGELDGGRDGELDGSFDGDRELEGDKDGKVDGKLDGSSDPMSTLTKR